MTPAEREQLSLCHTLGYSHPDEMLASLTVRQYTDWLQWHRYYKLSPDREDNYWALHLTQYQNAHVEHAHQRAKFEDYLMVYDPLAKYEQDITADDMRRSLGLRS